MFCEWESLPSLWGGYWSSGMLLDSAGRNGNHGWRLQAESEGRLILDFYILDPCLFNFLLPSSSTHSQWCLHSHSSSACHPHKLVLIAIYFHIWELCSYEHSNLYWHSTQSALLLNLKINNSCITVVFPNIALSTFAWFVDTWDNTTF